MIVGVGAFAVVTKSTYCPRRGKDMVVAVKQVSLSHPCPAPASTTNAGDSHQLQLRAIMFLPSCSSCWLT